MLGRESIEVGQVVGDLPGMVYMRAHTTVYYGARGVCTRILSGFENSVRDP